MNMIVNGLGILYQKYNLYFRQSIYNFTYRAQNFNSIADITITIAQTDERAVNQNTQYILCWDFNAQPKFYHFIYIITI